MSVRPRPCSGAVDRSGLFVSADHLLLDDLPGLTQQGHALLQIRQTRGRDRPPLHRVRVVRDLRFADATFDTVVCALAFCVIPDQRRALEQMLRVLRPGGLLLLLDHIEYTRWPMRRKEERKTNPRGARALDAGGGTGFYVDPWGRLGADVVTGCDMSHAAVERLRGRSLHRFVRQDVSVLDAFEDTSLDAASCMDVLFRVTDDDRYAAVPESLGRPAPSSTGWTVDRSVADGKAPPPNRSCRAGANRADPARGEVIRPRSTVHGRIRLGHKLCRAAPQGDPTADGLFREATVC